MKTSNFNLTHLVFILLVHFAARIQTLVLDLQPYSFDDEAMVAHNVFGMLYNNTWLLPPDLLVGAFSYYVTY